MFFTNAAREPIGAWTEKLLLCQIKRAALSDSPWNYIKCNSVNGRSYGAAL